jgi:polar amino acid transport system permease protein
MDYVFKWDVLWEYRDLLWIGLKVTLTVSTISLLLSLSLGTVIGVGSRFRRASIRTFCSAFVEFFRNIPLIVQLFFFYFAIGLDSFWGSVVGLSTYTAAFIAEIIRAGLQSIPQGNFEAAKSTGLSSFQTLAFVIVPHVFMITIPPLCGEFLNLIKNSSICMTIALVELTFQTQEIDAITYRGFEAATGITLIYIAINLVVAGALSLLEKRMQVQKRVG